MMANFDPCDANCPAVTGQPYNSVRYCPMAEPERHQRWKDWFDTLPYAEKISKANQHEDYTDCCSSFQCCLKPVTALERTITLSALTLADWIAIAIAADFNNPRQWAYYRWCENADLTKMTLEDWEAIAKATDRNEQWAYYRFKEHSC
jgi:hypothetical protein